LPEGKNTERNTRLSFFCESAICDCDLQTQRNPRNEFYPLPFASSNKRSVKTAPVA
jgi:hypothetical protein